jgi:hypothetical protein
VRFALSLALLTAGTAHAGPAAASPTLTSLRVAEYQDFVLARAKPLSEGSIPADTIIFICNPDEWREVMGDDRTCGERVDVPHTDDAGFLRVEATAADARTSKRLELTNAKVVITGHPIHERQALIGGDGAAVLQDIPAWTSYGVDVQPAGCGVFHFANQTVLPGRITTLRLDLGPLTSLDVLVTQEQGSRKVPLRDASVAAYWAGQSALIVGAATDALGHAVLECIRPGAKIDVRVTSRGYFWQDACAIEVGPGQQSPIQVLLKPNPDPRRIPIPSVCGSSIGRP